MGFMQWLEFINLLSELISYLISPMNVSQSEPCGLNVEETDSYVLSNGLFL